ncbi:MAG: hypothetical protein AAF160_20430 [Pseudomonadota bacterium]
MGRLLAPIILAMGLSASAASGAVIYDFEGVCSAGCAGTASAVIELDGYVPGDPLMAGDVVGLSYTSSNGSFTASAAQIAGATVNGALPGPGDPTDSATFNIFLNAGGGTFSVTPVQWLVELGILPEDSGFMTDYTIELRDVPVPAGLPLALAGLGLLYVVARRRS